MFLLSKENFDKYFKFIFELNLELETKNFLKTIQEYFSEYPDKEVLSVEELLVFFSVKHPILKKRTSYSAYLERLGSTEIDNKVLEENLNHFLEKYFASEMVFKLTEVLDGDSYSVLDEVQEMLAEFNERKVKLNKDEDQLFVKSNLTELLQEEVHEAGLRWRLSCLNESIGELRGGSLGHVFARVDTGKTSFIVSEVSNFASQLKDDEVILWCNNEEKGKRVLFRIYQSVLKCNKTDLINYPTDAEEEFTKLGGHKIKIYDQAIITVEDIEQLMKTYNVRLLVIDQGDKVRFSGDRDMSTVDRLKAVYGKFRELAKSYDCDVIAVGQASASAEGLKWLKTSDMDNSKCLGKGERVFMADGSLKRVEDIVVGDKVLNIFSKPETVVKTATGTEEMYKICAKDYSYTCNASHILTLKAYIDYGSYKRGDLVEVTVKDFLSWSKTKRGVFKQYLPEALTFNCNKDLHIDPYFMGVWLGDGASANTEITVADKEIEQYLAKYAAELGLSITRNQDRGTYCNIHLSSGKPGAKNILLDRLRELSVINNKHIPEIYLTSSVEDRRKLLAGLLDTDGCLNKRRAYEYFDWSTSRSQLHADMCRLLASLGIRYTSSTKIVKDKLYYIVSLWDSYSAIPTRVKRKQSSLTPVRNTRLVSFTVESLGVGTYYGFTLDGTGLFTHASGISLHNTGKPGELDYAIGIGKSVDDVDNPVCSIRYVSLCKNKMNEGKHGKYEVVFNASCALYTDKASGSFTEVSKSDDQSPQGSGSPEIKSTFKSLLSEIYGNPNMEQK